MWYYEERMPLTRDMWDYIMQRTTGGNMAEITHTITRPGIFNIKWNFNGDAPRMITDRYIADVPSATSIHGIVQYFQLRDHWRASIVIGSMWPRTIEHVKTHEHAMAIVGGEIQQHIAEAYLPVPKNNDDDNDWNNDEEDETTMDTKPEEFKWLWQTIGPNRVETVVQYNATPKQKGLSACVKLPTPDHATWRVTVVDYSGLGIDVGWTPTRQAGIELAQKRLAQIIHEADEMNKPATTDDIIYGQAASSDKSEYAARMFFGEAGHGKTHYAGNYIPGLKIGFAIDDALVGDIPPGTYTGRVVSVDAADGTDYSTFVQEPFDVYTELARATGDSREHIKSGLFAYAYGSDTESQQVWQALVETAKKLYEQRMLSAQAEDPNGARVEAEDKRLAIGIVDLNEQVPEFTVGLNSKVVMRTRLDDEHAWDEIAIDYDSEGDVRIRLDDEECGLPWDYDAEKEPRSMRETFRSTLGDDIELVSQVRHDDTHTWDRVQVDYDIDGDLRVKVNGRTYFPNLENDADDDGGDEDDDIEDRFERLHERLVGVTDQLQNVRDERAKLEWRVTLTERNIGTNAVSSMAHLTGLNEFAQRIDNKAAELDKTLGGVIQQLDELVNGDVSMLHNNLAATTTMARDNKKTILALCEQINNTDAKALDRYDIVAADLGRLATQVGRMAAMLAELKLRVMQ